MIRRIMTIVVNRFLKYHYFKKYGDIWKIKAHLQKQEYPDKKLLEIYNAYFYSYGGRIEFDSKLKGVPIMPHGPMGIFISGGAVLGESVVIFQHVTIGSNTLPGTKHFGSPVIGDNVYIGSGAMVIGNVHIGDNCRIGANAVVYTDMPANCVAVQAPTRIIQKEYLDNRYYSACHGKWVYYQDGEWIEDKNKTDRKNGSQNAYSTDPR